MSVFGAVIDPDGTVVFRPVDVPDDLWTTCGGWSTVVLMLGEWAQAAVMHVSDEAERLGMPMNPLASSFSGLWPRGVVRGVAVLLGAGDTDLPGEVAAELHDLAVWFQRAKQELGG